MVPIIYNNNMHHKSDSSVSEEGIHSGLQTVENPVYVQQPLIQAVVDHLLGKSTCTCNGESATLTNWVMDKILGKL